MFFSKRRIALLSALSSAALVGSFGLAALPATAGSVPPTAPAVQHQVAPHAAIPYTARGCTGNACIYLNGPYKSGDKYEATIHGCVWQTTVHNAYIYISSPGSWHSESATGTWYATHNYCTGSDDYYGLTLNADGKANSYPAPGKYCSTTFVNNTPNGTACETLSAP